MWNPQVKDQGIDLQNDDTWAVQSLARLGTVIALPPVYATNRYYEVTVDTNRGGILIGWVSEEFKKNMKNNQKPVGIGDAPESWALDSYTGSIGTNRVWKPFFKQKLREGDCVGCELNIDTRSIIFYLNGKFAGVAFSDIDVDNKIYYAACSLKYRKTCVFAAFGDNMKYYKSLANIGDKENVVGNVVAREKEGVQVEEEEEEGEEVQPRILPLSQYTMKERSYYLKVSQDNYEYNERNSILLSLGHEAIMEENYSNYSEYLHIFMD
eukprot:TRINITY_DN2586_c0_g3_i1.p1 TRINITY_DN2586_c0_g3~~TRINITY_DN2586_c0_g3_i1.p1  ORF type:complete len:267 (+),score=65.68 TRINITY_DN2586_c0_g3_i1:72-872(+)